MISKKNILCFGSENWEYPGFQQTLMRKFSESNKVIFVNPIGSRKIKLQYSQLEIYFNKIRRTFAKRKSPTTNCFVCSPWIIPLIYSSIITKLNQKLIKYQFSRILIKMNFDPYILWIGTPTASFILDIFNPKLIVYHAVDRYSEFSFVDREKIRLYEKKIAEKADVILCTSDAIRNDLIKYNRFTYTITHAVEFEHFHSAFIENFIPEDISDIPKPIIGYFGGLSERVNFALIKKIAIRYPHANIVLIGKIITDINYLKKYLNIHILGPKDYKKLPYYLKYFDVCLIPYYVNELMMGVDPIKLREYLCLGQPIVSVNLPEVKKLNHVVYIGEDEEDLIFQVGKALNEKNANLREKRIQIARQSDWSNKMDEISTILDRIVVHKEI